MSPKKNRVFFESITQLDMLKKIKKPSKADFENVLGIINYDGELTCYFYDKLSTAWLELLAGAKEFDGLDEKEVGVVERYKTAYLVDCAEERPKVVLQIIQKLQPNNYWIQGRVLEALLRMPDEEAIRGIGIVMKYFGGDGRKVWYWGGEGAANLMVKLKDKYVEDTFALAAVLVDAVGAPEEYKLRDMEAKFEEREYEELISKYYCKLFDVDAFRATGILVKILSRYVEQASKRDKYDVSSLFYIGMENLENIDCKYKGIPASLVKGICEGGREVIGKQFHKVNELLDHLENLDKAIFYRIEMYLLRFMPAGKETGRINRLIANKKFLEEAGYKYEYKNLLIDRFEEVSEETKRGFVEWVRNITISEERKREITEYCEKNSEKVPDFDKWENQLRAEELYLVREKEGFKGLYEEYKAKSGLNDSALAPRPVTRGEARPVGTMEGSPLTSEDMAKMSPEEVLDYVSNPKNYEKSKKRDAWQSAEEGLGGTLKEDVKNRSGEYLRCETAKLLNIPKHFLWYLLFGIEDAVRGSSFAKENWERFLEVSLAFAKQKGKDEGYKDCFRATVGALRDSFGDKKNAIEINEKMAEQFSQILAILVRFPTGDMNKYMEESNERDPVQLMCIVVAGEALGLTISLGISTKKRLANYWKDVLRKQMRDCWEFVLNNIKEPGVNCVFGLEFSRLHWLDGEWVENNLNEIFSKELWDERWGTYASWGRPSPKGFGLLIEKGKYKQAIEKIGEQNRFKFSKQPDDGLVEHLMIGYFNGWIALDCPVLVKFFERASAKLRGKAADFLATGFEGVKNEGKPYDEIAGRMRNYWQRRLEVIESDPQDNFEEAIEFTGWADNSLLGAHETLDLLLKTLSLTDGRVSRYNANEMLKAISELGKGDELIALDCLKKILLDENMRMIFPLYEKELTAFLSYIEALPQDYQNRCEIISKAIDVADTYGRFFPDKFRGIWERLNNNI